MMSIVCLAGCLAARKSGPIKDPGGVYEVFARALKQENYSEAYHCFSSECQRIYPYKHFWTMMTQTEFNDILRHVVLQWKLEKVETAPDGRTAVMVLRCPYNERYRKKFYLVREGDDWRLNFRIASLLGMPVQDEDYLYPEEEEKSPLEEPAEKEGR
jgi:hypothetical protein